MRDAFDVGIRIHRELGPGLFESVYDETFCHEMRKRGHKVERQKEVEVTWDGMVFDKAFRPDVLVDDVVFIEIKAVVAMNSVFERQLLTYLKLSGKRLGAVINFGMECFVDGFRRVVNGLAN